MPVPKPRPSLSLDFDEAVAYFRRHRAVTKDEWDRLDAAARRRAVRVASIAHRGVLNDVWKALEASVAKGTDFRLFKAEIATTLRKKYGAEAGVPTHLETIYLNETQRAFTHGRLVAALDPDVRTARPFWQFRAIEDNRITPICKECNGTIAEAGGSWWRSHTPPLHHRCRSSFITLTPAEAGRRGGVTNTPPATTGTSGFGQMPDMDDDGEQLTADKNAKLPAELRPKVEAAPPTGRPGHPERPSRGQPTAAPLELPIEAAPPAGKPPPPAAKPATPGDPLGEPVGQPIGEPIVLPPAPREKGPAGGDRRPRTAIERSEPEAKGPDNWAPGDVRSDTPNLTPGKTAPWRTGTEPVPFGTIEDRPGASTPQPHELRIDAALARQGNKVVRLPEVSVPAEGIVFRPRAVRPDREVNGHVTEYRSVFDRTSVGRALTQKGRRAQARNLVLDVSAAGVSRNEALYAVAKRANQLGLSFEFVRIMGADFDVTIALPIDDTRT